VVDQGAQVRGSQAPAALAGIGVHADQRLFLGGLAEVDHLLGGAQLLRARAIAPAQGVVAQAQHAGDLAGQVQRIALRRALPQEAVEQPLALGMQDARAQGACEAKAAMSRGGSLWSPISRTASKRRC